MREAIGGGDGGGNDLRTADDIEKYFGICEFVGRANRIVGMAFAIAQFVPAHSI